MFSVFSRCPTALFALPAARWADRMGTRVLLAGIVVWWSLVHDGNRAGLEFRFAAVDPLSLWRGRGGSVAEHRADFFQLDTAQGTGQGAGYFFQRRAFDRRPDADAGYGHARICFWRMIFICFGMLGFIWAGVWYWWFRDDPAEHAG